MPTTVFFILVFLTSRGPNKPSCAWSCPLSSGYLMSAIDNSNNSSSSSRHPWPLELPKVIKLGLKIVLKVLWANSGRNRKQQRRLFKQYDILNKSVGKVWVFLSCFISISRASSKDTKVNEAMAFGRLRIRRILVHRLPIFGTGKLRMEIPFHGTNDASLTVMFLAYHSSAKRPILNSLTACRQIFPEAPSLSQSWISQNGSKLTLHLHWW